MRINLTSVSVVVFSTTPTTMGPVTLAVFEDTCGNRIQIAQMRQ